MNKIELLVENLKKKFTESYSDGEVFLNELSDNPFSQSHQYIVTMHSPTKGTDRYLVSWDSLNDEASFVRILLDK